MSDSLEPKTNEEAASVQAETEATESVSSEGTQPVNTEEAPPVSEEASEPVNTEEVTPVCEEASEPVSTEEVTTVSKEISEPVSTEEVTPVCEEVSEPVNTYEFTPGNSETAEYGNADGSQPKKKSKKPLIFILSGVAAAGIIVGIILIIVLNAKSAEVKRVDDMISSIGTVTLDSKSKLAEAEKEVKALAEDDYKQLDNLGILTEARETYDLLCIKDEANTIMNRINAIGEVTLSSERSIQAARTAYDEADTKVHEYVENYDKLVEAENKYIQLQADNVISLINDIGTVTLESEDRISAAENAYNYLPKEAKDKVTNYSTLTSAREKINKLKREANSSSSGSSSSSTLYGSLKGTWKDLSGIAILHGYSDNTAILTISGETYTFSCIGSSGLYFPYSNGTRVGSIGIVNNKKMVFVLKDSTSSLTLYRTSYFP